MRNPTVCRRRSSLLDAISMSHCRWNGSPKRRASARASSVACFASKPGNRPQERSRTSGWKPPGWRWSKGGALSKQSRKKPVLVTGSACAERSYALLGKRRRRFATPHTHSLRSDRPISIHCSAFAGHSADQGPKRASPYRQSMKARCRHIGVGELSSRDMGLWRFGNLVVKISMGKVRTLLAQSGNLFRVATDSRCG
jgi:hypothetical protein